MDTAMMDQDYLIIAPDVDESVEWCIGNAIWLLKQIINPK